MGVVLGILIWVLQLYIAVLWARFIVDIATQLGGWRPRGALAAVLEVVYTITDPPIRFFQKILPPLRLGGVQLDFGFLLTLIACQILIMIIGALG